MAARKKSKPYPRPKSGGSVVRGAAVAPVARKNMDIDIVALAVARRVLGAPTDTETVNRALRRVARAQRIVDAFDDLRAAGGVADAFGRLRD
jgi:Arc/MetJ family transcription regulator